MFIINNRKIFYILSLVLVFISIVSIFVWKLKLGTDFTGGSLINISFQGSSPSQNEISLALEDLGLGDASIRSSEGGYFLRLQEISESQKNSILEKLSFDGKFTLTEKSSSSVGPILGSEAIKKSLISIFLVILAIVLFVAFAFRKVSGAADSSSTSTEAGISSWIYGGVAIVALIHDVIIPTGVFSILGHFYGFEVDTLFVTALLVILGFSVHDTIVVFDRVRENLKKNESARSASFEEVVGSSIEETFVRSINTSLTTLIAIFILYFFGPDTVKHFSLALIIGIIAGTYSSIFVGSPLLVTINNWRRKKF